MVKGKGAKKPKKVIAVSIKIGQPPPKAMPNRNQKKK